MTPAAICNGNCACAAENAAEMHRKFESHQFLAAEKLLHQNWSSIKGATSGNRSWGQFQKKLYNLLAGTAGRAPAGQKE